MTTRRTDAGRIRYKLLIIIYLTTILILRLLSNTACLCMSGLLSSQTKKGKLLISHRSTIYPCCLPTLGEFDRSWSYKTYPLQKYEKNYFRKKKCEKICLVELEAIGADVVL